MVRVNVIRKAPKGTRRRAAFRASASNAHGAVLMAMSKGPVPGERQRFFLLLFGHVEGVIELCTTGVNQRVRAETIFGNHRLVEPVFVEGILEVTGLDGAEDSAAAMATINMRTLFGWTGRVNARTGSRSVRTFITPSVVPWFPSANSHAHSLQW